MTMRLLAEVISSFDFFRDKKIKSPVKTRLYFKIGWRRRAEPELFFYQIISFKVLFNLVTLMT